MNTSPQVNATNNLSGDRADSLRTAPVRPPVRPGGRTGGTDPGQEHLSEGASAASPDWRIEQVTGGSGTISHSWIAVAPGCPDGRHPTRGCRCKVFRGRGEAENYVVQHGGQVA